MSTAVVVPPPNSSSVMRRVPRLTARARQLLTAVNLHFAGVAALIVLDLFLVAHLLFAWQAVSSSNDEAVSQQRVLLSSARVSERPLLGIDQKLANSTREANQFYTDRLPFAFSQVLTTLGQLTARSGVRLSRVQYGYKTRLSGPYALTEVNMDAAISGDYRSVIGAINALERSRVFFTISSITLSGQQTGQVNLRLHLTTYLRAANEGETAGAPPADVQAEPVPVAPSTNTPGGAQ